MTQVVNFAVNEALRIDARRVSDIVNELGETVALTVVSSALEQLASFLLVIEEAIRDKTPDNAITAMDRIAQLAWQVGLISLSRIAMDLKNCVRRNDPLAIYAVHARLQRVGNQSVTEIWERIGRHH